VAEPGTVAVRARAAARALYDWLRVRGSTVRGQRMDELPPADTVSPLPSLSLSLSVFRMRRAV
jgi:hypothetical protein